MNTSPLERMSWIAGIVSAVVALIVWLWSPAALPSTPAHTTATISSTQAGTTNIQVAGSGTIVINSAPATPQLSQPTSEMRPQDVVLPNHGPSFDCSKATYRSERIVCSSKELAILDLALANAYRDVAARVTSNSKPILRDQQNYWLRNIREQCPDIPCLRSIYEKRISEFKQLLS